MRDRVAIASSAEQGSDVPSLESLSGIAIWASVSEEVDVKIREQIKAGVFPVRLAPSDWTSGSVNWLFDVIAPNQKLTAAVIANFKQVIKEGDLRIHPLITRLVDPETLKKMGVVSVFHSKNWLSTNQNNRSKHSIDCDDSFNIIPHDALLFFLLQN